MNKRMNNSIDCETLIWEVRQRPELWDTSCELYRDRNKKKQSWSGVCRALFPDFDIQRKEEKIVLDKLVNAKWRTLRDSYVKSKKKESRLKVFGRKTNKVYHKYIYSEQLLFLEKCMEGPGNESDVPDDENQPAATSSVIVKQEFIPESEDTADSINGSPRNLSVAHNYTKPTTSNNPPKRNVNPNNRNASNVSNNMSSSSDKNTELIINQFYGKKKKPNNASDPVDIEKEILSYVQLAKDRLTHEESSDPDGDMAFFKSVFSLVTPLDKSIKLQFRIQVMSLLQIIMQNQPPIHNQMPMPMPVKPKTSDRKRPLKPSSDDDQSDSSQNESHEDLSIFDV